MRRAALFVLVAVAVYAAMLAVMLAFTGEVSCDEVCSPASGFLNDAYPVPMIAGVAFSLGIAVLVARRRSGTQAAIGRPRPFRNVTTRDESE